MLPRLIIRKYCNPHTVFDTDYRGEGSEIVKDKVCNVYGSILLQSVYL